MTRTSVASATWISTIEELIPLLHYVFAISLNVSQNRVDLTTGEPSALFEPYWFYPDFRHAIPLLNMYVTRLASIG